ncbi:MAG: thiamine S protein [Verrucomicrobia bacterium]|nr:MAG: thiamine S protein [Verrucomicrobiota bacterium]
MQIRVQFYSQLRDLAGCQTLDVDLDQGATVADLLEQLYREMPPLRAHGQTILIGAGVEFVERDYVIKPGDEISIMPPVQGG